MRFAMNILTPFAAFCLIGTAYECPAQEKHFDPAIVKKATEESPVADTTLLAVHCDEQMDDPRLAHVSTPSKGTQSGSEALQQPTFLKQPLLFTPNGLNLTARSRNNLHCAVANTMWREFSSSDIVTTRVRRSVPRRLRSAAQKSFVSSWCVSTPRRTKLRA